ncbi:DUF3108 domain-containing protein [Aliiglaciecola litoralis]|uniref:DUF3108 domain-containing protein n=1 Tax=Aliiglaciecola litoralis TaxID=582857 RepID=A0ABP3WM70_9ALTE
MEKNFHRQVMQLTSVCKSFILAVLLIWSGVMQATTLEAFNAQYKAFQYGKELGTASLELESLGRNRYRLSYQSKVSMFFLSDKRKEVSLFSYQDNQIIPFKYTYERTGFGSDKELVAEFDRQKNTIRINNETSLEWQQEFDNQLYRLDIQLQLASDKKSFSYDLINSRGELRHYDMLVIGKEQLNLPYGMLEGIKIKIMRENNKRETYAWFAPSLNYQLVRLQQFKEGEEQGDIQLSSFKSSR